MSEEFTVARAERGPWHLTGQGACGRFEAGEAAEQRRVGPREVSTLPGQICPVCFPAQDAIPDAASPAADREGPIEPTGLVEFVDWYLDGPGLSLSDPLTAVVGLDESIAARYADPTAAESYFGRYTSIETVGELLCSDASVRGVDHGRTTEARWELLAVDFDADDVARITEAYRAKWGDLAPLFGEDPPPDFDPSGLTECEVALLRYCTAFGYRVTPPDVTRPTPVSIGRDRVRDETYRHLSLYRRGSFEVIDAPLSDFHHPTLLTPPLAADRGRIVLLSTADHPADLANEDVDRFVTTHVLADQVVTASLLLRENFARPDRWEQIHFRAATDAELADGESRIYCVFEPTTGPYCYGLSTPLEGDLSYRTIRRLVREQLR